MITVYTKDFCPYCDGAKAYLKKIGEPYEEVNITNNPELREWMRSQGHKTVPQLYYNDKLLVEGGYTGLTQLLPADIQEKKRVIEQEGL
jgi:glutaredoxin 3